MQQKKKKNTPTQVTQDALGLRSREESTRTLIITFTITGKM